MNNLDDELLITLFKTIDNKNMESISTISKSYDLIYEKLNEIINENCADVFSNGQLFIMPCGDYLTNTLYELSWLNFYVIYLTNKENVNFAVVHEKSNKKGKKKVSMYQQLVGTAVNKGIVQAEEIAERMARLLPLKLPTTERYYIDKNEFVFTIAGNYNVRVSVCYDFKEDNNVLTMRNINQWIKVNPLKYMDNIEAKNARTDGNYCKFVKLFKALELELLISNMSEIMIGKNGFVENLLYNVPDELFMGSNYEEVLNKILSYLDVKNFATFKLIDESGLMFENSIYHNKSYAKQFINKINYACEDFYEIIKLSQMNQSND